MQVGDQAGDVEAVFQIGGVFCDDMRHEILPIIPAPIIVAIDGGSGEP
jgi:hypothetical protein